MRTFKVIQKPEWACPGMLVFVDENGQVIGHQANPDNALTQEWANEGEDWGKFCPDDYAKVEEIN